VREDIILKRWTFESGIIEGLTPEGDVTLSLSSDSPEGSQSLQLSAIDPYVFPNVGNVCGSLGSVPLARYYQVDYWLKEEESTPGLPNAGIIFTQGPLHTGFTGILADNFNYVPLLGGGTICSKQFNTWLHHSFVWEVSTGTTHYTVRDADNNLVGTSQTTVQDKIGMIPQAIWILFRAVYGDRSIWYDDIVVTAIGVLAPSSRRRRAAWMNMERPAVL